MTSRPLLRLLTIVLVMTSVGCGRPLPPQADPDQARAALVTALEAWKDGQTAEVLASRPSPIFFNDLNPDQKLVAFAIADGHEMYGQSVSLTATLTLRMPNGSTKERSVVFLIDTAPAVVIVRG